MTENKLFVLVADDHTLLRQGLTKILYETGIAKKVEEACNGLEALMKVRQNPPDLLLLDYDMPVYNAAYTCSEMLKEGIAVPVLVVSMHHSKEFIIEMITLGAKGFLPKESTSEELAKAIDAVSNGQTWFKGAVAEAIAEDFASRRASQNIKKSNNMTRREQDVFKHLAAGKNNKDVAAAMGISHRTVEVHKANIYRKFGFNNIAALVQYAVRHKLIQPTEQNKE